MIVDERKEQKKRNNKTKKRDGRKTKRKKTKKGFKTETTGYPSSHKKWRKKEQEKEKVIFINFFKNRKRGRFQERLLVKKIII